MLKIEQLHTYQKQCIEKGVNNEAFALLLDMGLGKTIISLSIIEHLIYRELDVNKALVIGTKRIVETVWHIEAAKWEHTKKLRVVRVVGTPKQRLQTLEQDADIYLISRDNVSWLFKEVYYSTPVPFDMLIVDESSSFKNPSSQRFKALKRKLSSFKRRIILTGTPSPKSLLDLWAQIYILDLGERLGRTMSRYKMQYFIPKSQNGHIVYSYDLRHDGANKIHNKINDIAISLKAESVDIGKLQRVDTFNALEMPPALRKQYTDFKREKILEIVEGLEENEPITVGNAAVLSNKLLQFCNGAVYDEDGVFREVHSLKLDALADLVAEANGEPLLVAFAYRSDAERILERFKDLKPEVMQGLDSVERWNNGEIKMMLLHPRSGGHGINLQFGGRLLVWFGLTWSLEDYQQLAARLDRQGQTNQVIMYHLFFDKSIENRVIATLDGRAIQQNSLLDSVKLEIEKARKGL